MNDLDKAIEDYKSRMEICKRMRDKIPHSKALERKYSQLVMWLSELKSERENKC